MKTNYFIINVSVANIYGEPDFTSPVVTQGLLGESCNILEENDNWVNIEQWDHYQGWINKKQGVHSKKIYDYNLTVFEMDGVVIQRNGNNIIRDLTFGNKLIGKPKNGGFDLIIEQTFFCAIDKNLRSSYAKKMAELLNAEGKLVGLLFNAPLNEDHPPYGGTIKEYVGYFEPYFNIEIMDPCYNSIEPRSGREVWIKMLKKG